MVGCRLAAADTSGSYQCRWARVWIIPTTIVVFTATTTAASTLVASGWTHDDSLGLMVSSKKILGL